MKQPPNARRFRPGEFRPGAYAYDPLSMLMVQVVEIRGNISKIKRLVINPDTNRQDILLGSVDSHSKALLLCPKYTLNKTSSVLDPCDTIDKLITDAYSKK